MKPSPLAAALCCAAAVNAQDWVATHYRLLDAQPASAGPRDRLLVDIEASQADALERRAATAMNAARVYHATRGADAVAVRLQIDGDGPGFLFTLTYAPDRCGWSGEQCGSDVWALPLSAGGELQHVPQDRNVS